MVNDETAALPTDRPAPRDQEPPAPHRLLVPLDGSPLAETIIPFVSRIARPLGLEIILLRVVRNVPARVVEAGSGRFVIDQTEDLRQEAEAYLRGIARQLGDMGFRTETEVRAGDAEGEILSTARERHVDMIAMATHGRSALGRLLFGSVAEAVLHRADIPVLLLRGTRAERERRAA